MNADEENISEIKGYLFIQSVKSFQQNERKDSFDEFFEPSTAQASYAGKGWYKITHLIPDGEFVKIAAERDAIRVDAKFNTVKNVPHGDNGSYEINGGSLASKGTFLNVSRKQRNDLNFLASDNADFARFFLCHSHSLKNGVPFLRWRIVLRDFSN